MINIILQYISDLKTTTAVLEALNWDEELAEKFSDELSIMLKAAPPNVEKALFWLRHTPWECFNGEGMSDELYSVIEKTIKETAEKIEVESRQQKQQRFLNRAKQITSDEEWN